MSGVKQSTANTIWGASAGLCAMCKQKLSHSNGTDTFPLGQIAHIEGDKTTAKRHRANQPDSERHGFSNLILLCGTCHTKIDRDETTYTVDRLKAAKCDHEASIEEKLQSMVMQISFAELEVILSYLVSSVSTQNSGTLRVIYPKDKIEKNGLTPGVENLLKMGLTQQPQIDDYLNKNPDMNFSQRLRSAFISKYDELKAQQLEGDAIFYDLLEFSYGANTDFKYRAAGLAVVSYYFNLCDIFEK